MSSVKPILSGGAAATQPNARPSAAAAVPSQSTPVMQRAAASKRQAVERARFDRERVADQVREKADKEDPQIKSLKAKLSGIRRLKWLGGIGGAAIAAALGIGGSG